MAKIQSRSKLHSRALASTVVAVAALAFMSVGMSPAHSANADTLTVYYDAPFVQSSYLSGTSNTLTETFNSANTGACPSSIAVGSVSGSCQVETAGEYGGAMSQFVGGSNLSVGDPATGEGSTVGTGTQYASNNSSTLTLNFAQDSKYFGIWWSAGTPSNSLEFYNGQDLVISLTTETIMSQFGSKPDPWPGSNTFTSIDTNNPTTYNKGWYFGNPRGYQSTSPSSESSLNVWEPYVYLHLFAGGDLTFDSVVLSGNGFEFDNVTVSTETKTPRQSLVLSQTIFGNHVVSFNSNLGTGSMASQVANSTTALSSNSFTREGFTFVGWNTDANGRGTSYADGADYSFDSDVTLFAQWTDNSRPAPTPSDPTLAATGSNNLVLLSVFGIATAAGLALVAQSARRRRRGSCS